MSSPLIQACTMANLADISAVLDGEVAYPEDMACLPTSTPNPSALKRKTRRSWFETTPGTSKLEIAVEKPAPSRKELRGEVEVLTLSHFTAAPRLDFGTMKPGQVKVCTLLLRNPHECEQTVKVEKVPEKKHFTVSCKAFTVGPGESYMLEVTWSPPEAGNFREMILMHVDKSYRLQAFVFGTVSAPPQKKKRRVGLMASKVSKPFSVIQTSSLSTINKQYSPDKNRRSGESQRRSNRLSGQGLTKKPEVKENNRKAQVIDAKSRNIKKKSIESKENLQEKEISMKSRNIKKKSIDNKENLNRKNDDINIQEKVPRKKMRRSNTYSNVSNQGLLIPVIHGDTVQGQMDTSLIDIVDKCNVSGIQPLEQSFNLAEMKNDCRSNVVEKPSFFEASNNQSLDLERIMSQIIPGPIHTYNKEKESNEPSFLFPQNVNVTKIVPNDKLQALKDNDTFHDSLENGVALHDKGKYQEQPSFFSPNDTEANPNSHCLKRSMRKSGGKAGGEQGSIPTEVKLLKSIKRRSGRRSISKEYRKNSMNTSAGSKSIIEQLKNLRTFIKEKSFEIESGDEPSFLKQGQDKDQDRPGKEQEVYIEQKTFQVSQGLENTVELRRDTFLADSTKMKLLESQKPSEASPRRTTFTVLRNNPTLKSPARSRSEGNKPHKDLAALQEDQNETEDFNKEESAIFVEGIVKRDNMTVLTEGTKCLNRKSESPTRLSVDSLENDTFEPMFISPKQLKLENEETFERRATLTVTKSRPSDALLFQMEKQTAKLFQADSVSFEITKSRSDMKDDQTSNHSEQVKITSFEQSANKSHSLNKSELSFPSTPNQLPSSPNPNLSRRSTHIVKQPRVIDLERMEQRELFQGAPDTNEDDQNQDSPSYNTRRRLSARRAIVSDIYVQSQSDDDQHENGSNGLVQLPDRSNNSKHRRRSSKRLEASVVHAKTPDEKEHDQLVKKPDKSETEIQGLVFIPFDDKDKTHKTVNVPVRPKTVVNPKQFLRKRGNVDPVASTMEKSKRVRKEAVIVPRKPTAPVTDKKSVQSTKAAVKETMTNLKNKTVVKQKPNLVKGLAQSTLILLKKSKTALPKHPLPFAAKNMYYDERWMEKQERGFVNWLNFILTPADEYKGNDVKVKVDAGKLAVDVAKGCVKLAPTNEVLSFRAYSAHRKLNRLRKSACRLFQSESVIRVVQKLEGEVESGRLVVRKDKMLHADIGLKQKLLDMLLCYNPLWLRIGMETIYGEVVPLQSNSDVLGLSRFILTRLLTSPDISQEFAHPTVPHLYRDGYAEATAAHSLKKFLMIVYFLDRAKQERLIEHNPCLFCKNSDVKATKDLLLLLSRDYLSGEGDITRHLGYLGYKVTYIQTALDEFDFAVSKLSTDLRDGLRLTKVLELLCNKPELSRTLRVPAISRLQKVHNVEVVFKALTDQHIHTDNVVARDVVDGHREKTLRLLWNIILHYQVEILLNETQLREEIAILEKSLEVKNQLQRLLKYSNIDKSQRESEGPDLHTQNPLLNLLLKWCRAVCAFFNIKVENFTVSFSDGRALCHIVHYYHPGLLPLDQIKNETGMTHMENMEKNANMNSSCNDSFNTSAAAFGDTEDPEIYEGLLSNERANFKLLFEKVKELGGIPLMLKWSDMSNTIPDEKVVVTYLLYLCARLLDIRHESRAARVIQLAWRKYRLKTVEAEFELKNRAAATIQKHVKDFLCKRRKERQIEASIIIQKTWRGLLGRKRVTQLKLEQIMLKQKQAVEKLQMAILGYLHRRRYLRMKTAVIQFQACCRGYLVRKTRNDAATIIQSAMRCYLAKKHVSRLRNSVIKIQSCIRGYIARNHAEKCKHAVVTLQRIFRATLAMKLDQQKYTTIRRSCILIQSSWRKYLLRKKENHISAAVKIQATFRGHVERRKFLQLRNSAVVLQTAFRAFVQRKHYVCQKQAVITLQRYFRNYKVCQQQHSEFQKLKLIVIFLQSQRRMIMEKKRYSISTKSVIKIQSTIKMFLDRRRFLKIRKATCVIQNLCRVYTCRRKYLISIGAAITIQAAIRGYIVRKESKRQHTSATVIQAFWRQVIARQKYQALKATVTKCQRRVRANFVGQQQRQEYIVYCEAVITTQKLFKGKRCRQQYLKDRDSIIKGQAMARMALARKYFLRLKNAARLIQTLYRAKKEGEKCRNELELFKNAAVRIQSVYRGYCLRKDICRRHAAATAIQSHVKCMLHKRQYHKLKEAVVFCQRRIRAKLACKHQLMHYRSMKSAAIVIQKFVRGHKCRMNYQASYRQIVKVQSICRMFIQRRRFLNKKRAVLVLQRRFWARQAGYVCKLKYHITREATITLQAGFRGLRVRKELNRQRQAAVCIQKHGKGYIQRGQFTRLKTAVLAMQKIYRAKREGVKCRQQYLEKKSAAVIVQRYCRGYQVRKDGQRKNTSATIIQTAYRRYHYQCKYLRLKKAVTICQRKYRAKLTSRKIHGEYQTVKSGITKLQALVRGKLCRKMYLRMSSARKIQSVYRMYRCKRDFKIIRKNILQCQAIVRGFLARKAFSETRRRVFAACVLQRRWRAKVKGQLNRNAFLELQSSTKVIQKYVRAKITGDKVRKEFLVMKHSAVLIQSLMRGFLQRKRYLQKRQAAVKLQSVFRGHLSRMAYLRLKNATLICQRLYRAKLTGVKARKDFCMKKQSAIVIQSFIRRILQRKRYQQQRQAAIKLQSVYRGRLSRMAYLKLKSSTIACQRLYRAMLAGVKVRKDFCVKKQSAIVIQSFVRRTLQRKSYLKQRRAAIKLQSVYRGRLSRMAYLKLKSSTIACQRLYRAKSTGVKVRKDFCVKKQSAIVIQSIFRGIFQRKSYLEQRQAVVKLQRQWRAKIQGRLERNSFLQYKSSAKVIQKYVRAKIAGDTARKDFCVKKQSAVVIQSFIRRFLHRKRYQQQRQAAVKLQRHWRAKLQGQLERNSFLQLQNSAKVIQKYIRAKIAGDRARKDFCVKKQSAIMIQSFIRRFLQRRRYLQQRQAAVKLQSVYRGHLSRMAYLKLKNATITCQRLYRARIAGRHEQDKYQTMRKCAILIQSTYKAFVCRRKYLSYRDATVKIQSSFRGHRDRKANRTCHKAAIVLQTYWRAELLCRKHVFEYHALRDAAIVVQKNFRAKVLMDNYLKMRRVAIVIQSNIRMWRARKRLGELQKQKQIEREGLLQRVVKVTHIHLAAIQIQRCYRNYRAMEVAKEKLHSVTLIQRWMKSKLQRKHYLQDRERVICLQKHIRSWLARRNTAASIIQRAVRRWLSTFEETKKIRAVTKIKALWKGYLVRRMSTSKKVAAVRKRVMQANASATEEKKLCNRTTSALDCLLRYKQMSHVLDALQHLEVGTRLSWSCCERMVETNAVTVLYRLMNSCNRSRPHMEIIKVTVNILLNLAKYDKTRASLYEDPEGVPTILELMQIYREKGPIFVNTCTLLGIMVMNSECRMAVMKDKKLTDKLRSIHTLTSRKHKLEENQRVTRAKMNATINSTFSVRSPVKKNKIKPDWALHKNTIKKIESPLKAINFVLANLGLNGS